MIEWAALIPFLSLGILGALHCAGMCGGFALAVSRGGGAGFLGRQLTYVVGKALSYMILALLVSTGAGWLELRGSHSAGLEHGLLRGVVGWFAAGFLILSGLGLLTGAGRRLDLLAGSHAWVERGRSLLRGVLTLPGASGALGLGLLNGLVPCGLSWSALVLSSQVSPPTAALGALGFGLATGPVLIAVGLGARLASPLWRRASPYVLGSSLLLFGGLTAWRSTGALGGEPPSCCSHGSPGQSRLEPQRPASAELSSNMQW